MYYNFLMIAKMKVINSFTYLLIVGILSFTTARGYTQPTCTSNGGPEADKLVIENSAKNFQECFQIVQNELSTELQKNTEGKMDAVFALYCVKVEPLKHCLKQFTESIKSCLKSDEHETIDFMNNVGASLFQYGCENSKLLQQGFKKNCDTNCLNTKMRDVANCGSKFINGLSPMTPNHFEPETDIVEKIQSLKISFDKQGCRDIQDFEECSVEVMKDRDDPIYSQILDSIYKYINNDIPCKDLPKSPRSNASPASIVNAVLLLIAMIAIIW